MKVKLRKNERCPIHGWDGTKKGCCGREPFDTTPRRWKPKEGWKSKSTYMGNGVWRTTDEDHPRGYRERRDAHAMKKLLLEKIAAQDNKCALCGETFEDFRQIIPEHIEPKGMGGARRDDHPDNIQAAHHWPCNVKKGSERSYDSKSKVS